MKLSPQKYLKVLWPGQGFIQHEQRYNASAKMHNMTFEVDKQEIMDAGTRNGLTRCPLSTVIPRPVRRMKGQSPQWHCGRHGVQDTQLSQSLGLSKPLFVTRFTLGAGLRKVENSCLNCKALLKIMQHSRLKIDLCWLQTSGWICLSPSNDFSVK